MTTFPHGGAAQVFRDFLEDGNPASDRRQPPKYQIRDLLGLYEQLLNTLEAATGDPEAIADILAAFAGKVDKTSTGTGAGAAVVTGTFGTAFTVTVPIASNNDVDAATDDAKVMTAAKTKRALGPLEAKTALQYAVDSLDDFERWIIGEREAGRFDVNGFYLRLLTVGASAKVDDDLSTALSDRILKGALGSYFEAYDGVWRVIFANRLLMEWDQALGFYPRMAMLPAAVKIDDQPTINLTDRLSGGDGAIADNGTYMARNEVIGGLQQISTIRKSDGHRFAGITSGPSSNLLRMMTSASQVVYWSVAASKLMYMPAEGGAAWPVEPDGTVIECWGDSIVQGAGSSGSGAGQGGWVKQLFDVLGSYGVVSMPNRGVGGQQIEDISARLGAAPALITVAGDQIPASGSVAVTAYSTDLLLSGGTSGAITLTGWLAGVYGTLSGNSQAGRNTATYSFARATAGSITACPAATPFIPELGAAAQAGMIIADGARNNAWANPSDLTAKAVAMRDYNKALYRRFLMLDIPPSIGDLGGSAQTQINAVNSAYATALGDDLVSTGAPTTQEMADLALLGGPAFVPDSYGVYSNGRTDAADINGRACGYFAFSSNPSPGDSVTVAGTAITFVASGVTGPQVNIGASAAATAAALAAWITANLAGSNVMAVGGTTAASTVLCTVAATVNGTAGNAITLAKSSSALTVSGATLTQGSATGVMPSGMRSGATTGNGDWLHPNNFGYALITLRLYRTIKSKGWYPALPLI